MKKRYLAAILFTLLIPTNQIQPRPYGPEIAKTAIGLLTTAAGGIGTWYCIKKNSEYKKTVLSLIKARKQLKKLSNKEKLSGLTKEEEQIKKDLTKALKTKATLERNQTYWKLGIAGSALLFLGGGILTCWGVKNLIDESKNQTGNDSQIEEEPSLEPKLHDNGYRVHLSTPPKQQPITKPTQTGPSAEVLPDEEANYAKTDDDPAPKTPVENPVPAEESSQKFAEYNKQIALFKKENPEMTDDEADKWARLAIFLKIFAEEQEATEEAEEPIKE